MPANEYSVWNLAFAKSGIKQDVRKSLFYGMFKISDSGKFNFFLFYMHGLLPFYALIENYIKEDVGDNWLAN